MSTEALWQHMSSEQDRRRAKFLFSQARLAALVFAPLGIYNLLIGYVAAAVIDLLAVALVVGINILVRRRGFDIPARLALAAGYLGLLQASIQFDGESALYWAPLLMVASFLLFDRVLASIVSIALIGTPVLALPDMEHYALVMFVASHLFLLLFLYNFIATQEYWDRRMLGGMFVEAQTRALNRKAFDLDLSMAAEDAGLGAQSLVLLDIDRFKSINDTHGHAAGDACLARFADRTRQMIDGRPVTLYRYGGDEFALLSALTLSETHDLVEALRASIARTSLLREVPVTISAGIAPLEPKEPPHHALRRADRALYRAKENGRDRIELAPPARAIPSGEKTRDRDASAAAAGA